MEKETKNSRHAIIIGAGPAGLTAAWRLLTETDIKPVILEASSCIGGISRTVEHNGNRMDIGGHRFFSRNAEVLRLWESLLPLQGKPALDDAALERQDLPLNPHGPDPAQQDAVMLLRNRLSRILFSGRLFDYPISMSVRTVTNMGLRRTAAAGIGYVQAAIRKRPENSLEDFYINRFGKPLYRLFFEDYTAKVWGRHPSAISAEWGAQRVKGLSLGKTLLHAITRPFRQNQVTETSLIEQFHYPKKGPGQLWEALAEKIRQMGGIIRLNETVTKINLAGNRIVSVETTGPVCSQTSTFGADYFLSSMTIKDLFAAFAGPVPADARETALALPYRDFMTVGLLVNRLSLKNNTRIKTLHGGIPDCWIYIQDRAVRLGRLQIFNNWSPYLVADPRQTLWIGLEYFCDEGDPYWQMSDDAFIRFAVDELVKLNMIKAEDVLDSVRLRVQKAYPAYFGAYGEFASVRTFLDQIDNLYCIGRNGQHRYNNMDHSMLTAMEAVRAIQGLTEKASLWTVNAEKEYHEA
jgi:protoporphyrinogen oxidase